MIETLLAGVTAFDIYYARLPDTAYSYDGEERTISQFYDQKLPNVMVGGNYNKWNWELNSGTHTKKLNTASMSLGYAHRVPLKTNGWTWDNNLTGTLSYISHTPCTDSYGREYLCTNLTAFSDYKEDKLNEIYEISTRITYRW